MSSIQTWERVQKSCGCHLWTVPWRATRARCRELAGVVRCRKRIWIGPAPPGFLTRRWRSHVYWILGNSFDRCAQWFFECWHLRTRIFASFNTSLLSHLIKQAPSFHSGTRPSDHSLRSFSHGQQNQFWLHGNQPWIKRASLPSSLAQQSIRHPENGEHIILPILDCHSALHTGE